MAANQSVLDIKHLFSPSNIRQLAAPILLLAILAMMVLPLPPFILDVCFTFNIAISMMVLLVAMYSRNWASNSSGVAHPVHDRDDGLLTGPQDLSGPG